MISLLVRRNTFLGAILFLGIFAISFELIPTVVNAHGEGFSLTATTTDYIIDVDYDYTAIFSGDTGRFNFNLFKDATRTKKVDFTKVWARIVRESDIREGDTVFSGWIAKAVFGSTGLSISLPESGAYTMIVRYNNDDDNKITEATLPFTVYPGTAEQAFKFGIEFWSGIAGGLFLALIAVSGFVLRKRLSTRDSD